MGRRTQGRCGDVMVCKIRPRSSRSFELLAKKTVLLRIPRFCRPFLGFLDTTIAPYNLGIEIGHR